MDPIRSLRRGIALTLYLSTPIFALWWLYGEGNTVKSILHIFLVPYFAKYWVLPSQDRLGPGPCECGHHHQDP